MKSARSSPLPHILPDGAAEVQALPDGHRAARVGLTRSHFGLGEDDARPDHDNLTISNQGAGKHALAANRGGSDFHPRVKPLGLAVESMPCAPHKLAFPLRATPVRFRFLYHLSCPLYILGNCSPTHDGSRS